MSTVNLNKDVQVGVRMRRDEKLRFEVIAQQERMRLSEWFRHLARREVEQLENAEAQGTEAAHA